MNAKNKIILSVSIVILLISLTVVTIVGIWAATQQNFTSSIRVRYTSLQVIGNATAQWTVGNNDTWHDMTVDGKEGSKTQLDFGDAANEDAALLPTTSNIELTEDKPFVVFKYTFTNNGNNDFYVDLSYNDTSTDDSNIVTYSLNRDGADALSTNYLGTITQPYSNKALATVQANKSRSVYILAKVINEDEDAVFSGDFTCLLDGRQPDSLLSYTSGSTVTINGFNGDVVRPSKLSIPSTIDGKSVTAIDEAAFADETDLVEVTIPNSVQTIGFGAFSGCPNIANLTIPFVGESRDAGADANYLGYIFGGDDYTYNQKSGVLPKRLRTLTITDMDTLPDHCLYYCQNLTTINLPENLTTIGNNVFQNCTNLANFTLPNTVETIGNEAFRSCSFLTTINIPASVTQIGTNAFNSCKRLTEVRYEGTLQQWCENYIAGSTDYQSTQVISTNPVRTIYINGATIPTELVIPAGTTRVSAYAFYNQAITSVTIPASVTGIGIEAFNRCNKLTTVKYEGTLKQWCESGITADDNSGEANNYLMNISPSRELYIGGTKITGDLRIPDDAGCVYDYAFYGLQGITNVTIGNNVQQIYSHAFERTSITSLTIGTSVTLIDDSAFANCKQLTGKLTIPDNVTEIGGSAFKNTGITGLKLSSQLKNLKAQAFSGCTNLTGELVIPSSVETIYQAVFQNCFQDGTGGTLTISEGVLVIMQDAFSGCYGLKGELNIPNSVVSINPNAFKGCNQFTSLTIGSGLNYVEPNAFQECSASLTSIKVDAGNTYFTSRNSNGEGNVLVEKSNGNLLLGCNTSVLTANDEIVYIESHAFLNCKDLTHLIIPNSVRVIDGSAFEGSGLTEVVIPTGVSTIEEATFKDCTNLQSVTIPSTVTEIYDLAFAGCTSINNLIIPSGVANIYADAFKGCTSLTTVYINSAYAWESLDFAGGTGDGGSHYLIYYATTVYVSEDVWGGHDADYVENDTIFDCETGITADFGPDGTLETRKYTKK